MGLHSAKCDSIRFYCSICAQYYFPHSHHLALCKYFGIFFLILNKKNFSLIALVAFSLLLLLFGHGKKKSSSSAMSNGSIRSAMPILAGHIVYTIWWMLFELDIGHNHTHTYKYIYLCEIWCLFIRFAVRYFAYLFAENGIPKIKCCLKIECRPNLSDIRATA